MKRTLFRSILAVILLSCASAAQAFEHYPIGWVTVDDGNVPYNLTGGSAGAVVTATNETEFKTYAESPVPYVILVPNTIVMTRGTSSSWTPQTVSVQSNKTIIGVGPNGAINGGLEISGRTNVIIRNLTIWYEDGTQGSSDPWTDGITIKYSDHIWVDHCTLYDSPDGLIDTTNGSNYITISWCRFGYTPTSENTQHHFTNLVGGSDSATGDRGKLKVTFHHNLWGPSCKERMPRVRFGQVHIFNNYFDTQSNSYCVRSGIEAQNLIENNYFNESVEPIEEKYDPTALIEAHGNILYNCKCSGTYSCDDGDDDVFDPPYSYTLDDANDVPAIVSTGAGASVCYGDFDRNELVDYKDLAVIANHWLEDDVDIEYYLDGIVNFRECALLIRNWGTNCFTPPAAPQDLTTAFGDGQILLDWSDNNEPDLAGYDVYRSETWSNHTKINSSLIIDSNYTDSNVVNLTAYFYTVVAIDTLGNDSEPSEQVSEIPVPAGGTVIQENELGYCRIYPFGSISKTYNEYTGNGYCDTFDFNGSGIEWSISVPSTGSYTFIWRYANGALDRPAKLLVDDIEEISSINFPVTGSWSNWEMISQSVTLCAGTRSIKLQATNSKGLANIDCTIVTGDNPQPASCP
ncbi:MAG: carbohydrate-binding protein [Sedimentisphaerales bacterium]|nr:carbohydrate-binding protein [Sedimentisphaerales bacterium]